MVSKTLLVDVFARTCSSIVRSSNLHIIVDSCLLSNSGIFVDVSIGDSSREANAIITRKEANRFCNLEKIFFSHSINERVATSENKYGKFSYVVRGEM